MVECHLAKVDVEGSNPFSRSAIAQGGCARGRSRLSNALSRLFSLVGDMAMRGWWKTVGASLGVLGATLACGKLAPEASDGSDGRTDASSSNPAGDPSATTQHDASAPSPAVDAAAPPQADGVCSQTAMNAGAFDADCVYLLGTLSSGGDAWRDALIHMDWSCPGSVDTNRSPRMG